MGARPSSYKKGGGGFLNNKDVTLVGVQIEVEHDVRIKNGKRAGETWSPIKMALEFREDGASETVSTHLLIGDADRHDYGDISEDGLSLEDPKELGLRDSEAGGFVSSLCACAEFPEDRFDDDPTSINLSPMIGTRMRVEQLVDEKATKLQGKQKGKDGKDYDRRRLVVAQVYSVVAVTGAAKGKSKGKQAVIDVQAAADEVIALLVEKAGGSLKKAQLSAKLQVSKAKFSHLNGEWAMVSKLVMTDDYLMDATDRGVIDYTPKTQMIAGAA